MIVSTDPGERLSPEYLSHLNTTVNNEQNPVMYLGIDPGRANGICGYDAKYYLQFMLTVHADDMVMFLNQFQHIATCVIEGYRVYPHKLRQHIYSDLETSRVIGRVEGWATRGKITLVVQGADIKSIGYKWIGKKPLPKSNRKNHELDAHVHFMYWAVKNGRIPAHSLVDKRD